MQNANRQKASTSADSVRTFLQRLKRASHAAIGRHAPGEYFAKGESVTCPVCSGGEFLEVREKEFRRPFLSKHTTPWLEFDRRVTTLVCTHCANLLHFAVAPERGE